MSALLLSGETTETSSFKRSRMTAGAGARDEKWLQELLFENPELVVLDQIEPGAGDFVPLVREFALPREGGVVFLDILGVSRSGRLVLIECKLWRNPQARREVIAQTLEYAALTRGMSYADLTAKMRQQRKDLKSPNPIYDLARTKWSDLDESAFVDGVARSLDFGDFYLVVAGDGIRSDLHAISEHLDASGLAAARFALLELQLWTDERNLTFVVPSVPVRTEIIRQRVLLGEGDRPIRLAPANDENDDPERRPVGAEASEARSANRAFWQKFIDSVRFDHPDQGSPRHGGNNWTRVPLPAPINWMTGYRYSGNIGFFTTFSGDDATKLFEWLEGQADAIRQESGLAILVENDPSTYGKRQLSVTREQATFEGEEAQLSWLRETANVLVNTLRPLVSQWHEQTGGPVSN